MLLFDLKRDYYNEGTLCGFDIDVARSIIFSVNDIQILRFIL